MPFVLGCHRVSSLFGPFAPRSTFLGGGLLQQNALDALLETLPLAINVWMTLEVTVIARLSFGTATHPKV
jgi:hypothetical protein